MQGREYCGSLLFKTTAFKLKTNPSKGYKHKTLWETPKTGNKYVFITFANELYQLATTHEEKIISKILSGCQTHVGDSSIATLTHR